MLLAVLGALLVLVGGFLLYARQQLFEPEQLAGNARSAIGDERFRLALAQPIVEGILDGGPVQLVNARPLIEGVVVAALGTPPAKVAFADAVESIDAKLVDKDPNTLFVNLTDAAVIAASTLEAVSPKLGSKLPKEVDKVKTALLESEITITPLRFVRQIEILGIVLPLLSLLALVGSVAAAPDRRRAVQRAGIALASAAAAGLAILLIARSLALAQFDDPLVEDAVSALWEALLGGLFLWVVAVGIVAVIFAAASRFGAEEVDPLSPLTHAGNLARRRPTRPILGVIRGLAIALVGVCLIVEPVLCLSVVAIAIGTWLLYVAVVEVLAILAPRLPESESASVLRRVRPLRVATAVLAVAAVVVVVIVAGGGERSTARPLGPPAACNGYAELCDKRLDEVTFPATHNAMSAAEEPGWFLTNQRYGITRQLDDGIRALLIDTHYGTRASDSRRLGAVVTDLQRESKTRDEIATELGPETVDRVTSLINNLAFDGDVPGESKPFLCHVICELGATDFDVALDKIDAWMQAHPDEFLIIFIEDVVKPGETVAALEASGLMSYAYVPAPGVPGPTLGQLIQRDKRLLVMAERDSGGGAYPDYVQGFDLVQETPYTFKTEREIASIDGCRPNRGEPGNPLFQINNWIEKVPRDPDLQGRVNARKALLKRARLCGRDRGLRPNILAVDYYDRGDVTGVANVLNGLDADAEPSVRVTP